MQDTAREKIYVRSTDDRLPKVNQTFQKLTTF